MDFKLFFRSCGKFLLSDFFNFSKALDIFLEFLFQSSLIFFSDLIFMDFWHFI